MQKEQWKRKITKACKDAHTYQPYFSSVIDTLAGIMEARDDAEETYVKSGRKSVVKHTNKGGATNVVKNPALVVIMDCNSQALAYWRDLGLTPSGMKKLRQNAIEENAGNLSFEQLLADIVNDDD